MATTTRKVGRHSTPRSVGTLKAATLVMAAHNGERSDEVEYLDAGLYRNTYRHRNTVYKVCQSIDDDDQNVNEHTNAQEARKAGLPGIPPTSLHYVDGRPIVAMPFYPKDSYEARSNKVRHEYVEAWSHYFQDLHGGNYRCTAKGEPRLTDLQFGEWSCDYNVEDRHERKMDEDSEYREENGGGDEDEEDYCEDCDEYYLVGEDHECPDRCAGCGCLADEPMPTGQARTVGCCDGPTLAAARQAAIAHHARVAALGPMRGEHEITVPMPPIQVIPDGHRLDYEPMHNVWEIVPIEGYEAPPTPAQPVKGQRVFWNPYYAGVGRTFTRHWVGHPSGERTCSYEVGGGLY